MSKDRLIKIANKIIEYAPMYTSTWESAIFADARKLASSVCKIIQEDWQAMSDPRLQVRLLASYLVKLDELLERWLDIETQRRQGNLEDMPPSSPSRRLTRRFDFQHSESFPKARAGTSLNLVGSVDAFVPFVPEEPEMVMVEEPEEPEMEEEWR